MQRDLVDMDERAIVNKLALNMAKEQEKNPNYLREIAAAAAAAEH